MSVTPDTGRARRGRDLTGQRFGDLEILVELARGGMGTVYIARHTGDAGFERLVAVKCILRPQTTGDDLASEASVLDEIRLSALLRHPNIVATTAVREESDCFLLVSDYVEGVSLAELLRAAQKNGTRLDPAAVACVVHDVLRGLSVAHDQTDLEGEPLGLVHRDLTPQNILVGVDGVARILDFGIAKAHGRAGETQEGILKGKPPYLSPEQVRGESTDRRSDLFSLGTVLYESLCGEKPFLGTDDSATLLRILLCEYDSAPLTPAAENVVAGALTLYPKERFQTAREFATALKAALAPNSHDDVAECVQSACGTLLAGRKARLAEALARVPEESLPPPALVTAPAQTTTKESDLAPVTPIATSAHSAPLRPRALGLMGAGLMAVALAVTLFWRSQPTESLPAPARASTQSVQLTLIPRTPVTQFTAAPLVTPTATTSPERPSVSARPAHPPEASAKTPGLHANPYGEPNR